MDEHKENIHAEDVNVKMSNAGEDEKVSLILQRKLASCFDCLNPGHGLRRQLV